MKLVRRLRPFRILPLWGSASHPGGAQHPKGRPAHSGSRPETPQDRGKTPFGVEGRFLQGPKGRKFADYASRGQTIIEYILLLGVSLGIFLLISRWGLKILQGYFGFISFLYSGFMTLFP